MPDLTVTILLMLAVLVIAIICATLSGGQFSGRIFLCVFAIGIAVLTWLPVIPIWFIIFPVLIIASMFIGGGAENE